MLCELCFLKGTYEKLVPHENLQKERTDLPVYYGKYNHVSTVTWLSTASPYSVLNVSMLTFAYQ